MFHSTIINSGKMFISISTLVYLEHGHQQWHQPGGSSGASVNPGSGLGVTGVVVWGVVLGGGVVGSVGVGSWLVSRR